MVLFAGPAWFDTELTETFHSLVEDPHALVRRTVACGFHEVCYLMFMINKPTHFNLKFRFYRHISTETSVFLSVNACKSLTSMC